MYCFVLSATCPPGAGRRLSFIFVFIFIIMLIYFFGLFRFFLCQRIWISIHSILYVGPTVSSTMVGHCIVYRAYCITM